MHFRKTGNYFMYITTNPGKTVLYTGMTNDLKRRMNEHFERRGETDHFAEKFFCYNLIYFEMYVKPMDAILREKEVKNLTREKKMELIKKKNPRMNFYRI